MKKHRIFWLLAATILAAGCSSDDTPTPPPPPQACDLSAQGTANCYLISGPGDYSFDATVMGNGVSTERAPASRLAPVAAGLVWQDTPGLLSDVELCEGRVCFTAGGKKGNALLAVYDAGGKVLWSWHIWATDYDPASGAAKLNGLTWMTLNLGAVATDYDASGTVKGMVYQWGRKDPFPSVSGWTDAGGITVYDASGSTADPFRTEQVARTDNLAEAVAHPTTFYSGTRDEGDFGPYDWLTTDASAMNDRLWETMTDSGKTLFDPCPPGWRVPRKESWTGLNETNFIWDDAALGRRHALLGYYPAVGSRGAATGEWNFVGGSGLYWSSSATEDCYVSKLNFLPAYINVQSNANRASGFPVRCVSETAGDPGEDPGTIEKYELDRVTESAYIGFAGDDASANYYIGLANVPFELSDEGEQLPTQPGMIMYLDLYGDTSIDPKSAVLPDGTYTVRSETTSGSANATYTWARMMTDEHEIVYRRTTGGKVKVRRTDGGYSIEGTFRSSDGPDFTISYTGEIAFTDRTPGPSVLPIVDPVNARFTEAVAQWEYSGDQSDRFTIRLLDGRMENDELAEGYRLTIDLLSEKLSEKGNIVIQPGRYSIGSDYVSPMTFSVGALYSLMGIPMYTGTYCQQARPDGLTPLCGFASDGTIEVERSGDRYAFTVDITTAEGVSVKGTYAMNEVTFIDNAPYEPAGDWLSILREDKTVIFAQDDASKCRVWRYDSDDGEPTEFEILVDNNTTDEAFQLLVLAPAGSTSLAGTYTAPADPDRPGVGNFVPGYKQLSMLKGTWGYLLYDFRVTNYVGAPATEGTIEIRDLEDGKIEIQYEVKDDAEPQNTVRSVWSGSIRWIN